ncbi:GNAT family N-acetyltransferase [Planctomycetota bacterium]
MNNNKERYQQHCREENSVPIFSQDWWLDTVCANGVWDVALVTRGGKIIGSMPYFIKKRMGLTLLTQPPLTQTLGPWIRAIDTKHAKMLSYQKDVMSELIEQLPSFDYFSQNWHYHNLNWKPFYWKGFRQTTFYTFVLPDLRNETRLWDGLEAKIRTDIRKASDRYKLCIREDPSIDDFLRLQHKTFDRQGKSLPYDEGVVRRLDYECVKRKCRKIWIAEDDKGRQHAGAYIVWNENSAYYLMGGGDPGLRNSGATSYVLWEAIKQAATVTKRFDFEGSMVESIERFFRAFGGQQELIFNVNKTNSKILRLRQCLLAMLGQQY